MDEVKVSQSSSVVDRPMTTPNLKRSSPKQLALTAAHPHNTEVSHAITRPYAWNTQLSGLDNLTVKLKLNEALGETRS